MENVQRQIVLLVLTERGRLKGEATARQWFPHPGDRIFGFLRDRIICQNRSRGDSHDGPRRQHYQSASRQALHCHVCLRLENLFELRDHPALEHFVGDRRCDAIEELLSHLWVLVQHLDHALLSLFSPTGRRMLALDSQFLTRWGLIFLHDPFGHAIKHRILLSGGARDADYSSDS
jgi:hypothetical protein